MTTEIEFAGLDLLTAPGVVMTPRPASLALVECALRHVGTAGGVVVDVGTGSGAIAVAIARSAPHATVWATDVSAEAVALARRNAASQRRRRACAAGLPARPGAGSIDVVVANLPYLPRSERALHPDLELEPDEAVFASGDGLGSYRRLLEVSAGATVARRAPGRTAPR